MYAVIETGGKQHRISEGEVLKIEMLPANPGETVTFDKVLLVHNGKDAVIGAPYVQGASVTASVLSIGRHDKVTILKFRRRKHHMKRQGHRQWYTAVKITSIAAV